jgi:aryl-alcohol dehydrogenase-like predicted oxidoreductase
MQESDPDVCLLASQYSLIDHANALNNVFPVARQRNVKFVIGSSLNDGPSDPNPSAGDSSDCHIDVADRCCRLRRKPFLARIEQLIDQVRYSCANGGGSY